ncbi:tumor necrosis factor alpha-induced protein 8-like protein 1 [Piliocolobus tephrosceles]|uniref:tumor necrosis factor alpha-induced protein 8-like protein 1 n=1 Tax=Piliocolobus tephrosceles TaxID=591936 RepID=UPI000C2AF481|nr:tumor necrosis factor alpha-induced protein 8-like protein 1 [Piliocolobus tephrosceles]
MDIFSTKSLALQAQKKLLSKMTSKAVVAMLVYDTSREVMEELYHATREFTCSCKEAQKMLKNLVKVALKLGLLLCEDQVGGEELALLWHFCHRAHFLAMMAISFQLVEFTFDRQVLAAGLLECGDLLHQVMGPQLTAKRHSCIKHVFHHQADCVFLAVFYGPTEPYHSHLRRICEDLGRMLDEGSL